MNAAVDAVVALLLISAAVGVVVTADQSPATPSDSGRADAVADTLAATTATVNYSLAPGVRELNRSEMGDGQSYRTDSPELDRTTHGSLAGLLARATTATSGVAVADRRVDPERKPLTRSRAGLRRGVGDAVRARTGAGVRIDATWRPYPDAPVGGHVGVGPAPPADGVHTATLVVPTGVDPIPATKTVYFEWLGRAVAERTVAVLVPAEAARITLRGDDPAATLVAYRYARLAARTNTSLAEPLTTEDTAAANARVAESLGDRMTADLRRKYDHPTDAADAVSVSSVRIVVRTWSGPGGTVLMRLADDDRARIPFALVGVLLLVGSATLAPSLATSGPSPVDRSADVAADRVDAETTAALRGAVRDAARAAAREPVTAASTDGPAAALAGPNTFRKYLRLRILLAARDAVAPIEHRRGAAVASVSLGESVDTVPAALDRVSVSAVDGGTELRATVRGLELQVEHDGRVVDTRRLNRTVTVGVPVLALHDRTVAFQERLHANPIESPGLARRMTVGLTAVAQARGLGQYAGLPISNVVANRHVALSTNAGLLDAQRATFGRTDPDAAAGVRAATLRTGVTDLLSPHADSRVVSAATGRLPDPNAPEREPSGETSGALPATRTVTVGVNGTADRAFLSLLRGTSGGTGLDTLRREGYGATVSVSADRRTIRNGYRPRPSAPGEDWVLAFSTVSTDVSVTGSGSDRPDERVGTGSRVLYRATRRVVERHTVERTWIKPNVSSRTTVASWRDVSRVRITATGRLDDSPAPSRAVQPLFEPGGALGGPNIEDAHTATRDLVSELGGPDAIARNAATGGRTSASTAVTGERPADLSAWIYEDLTLLREQVRNISVEIAANDAATGQGNGAARLAAAVRDRRSELVDAPREYDGVADRTRVAARAAYLNRVLGRLDARAGRTGERNDGIGRALDAAGITPERANELADLTPEPAAQPSSVGSGSGVRGETVLIPDADPAYLAPSPVDGRLVDGIADDEQYVGLAVRNLNVFAVPYGDAADIVTRTLLGDPGQVSLHTAGGALVAADRTLAVQPDPTLRARRDALEPKVERSMVAVRQRAVRTLARETELSSTERREVVDRAFDRWDGPGHRALAATNGSLARATASAAVARLDGGRSTATVSTDRIRTALRVELRRVATSKRVRVSEAATQDAVSATRKAVEREVTNVAERATKNAITRGTNGTVTQIPAGLPISPTFSPWIATINVWVVESRGAYGRFAVRTESGSTTYVRDGTTVSLDVDNDGVGEQVGRNERIEFSVRTVAVVAVPAGGFGVGDTDGNADERSVAWADPEPGPRCVTPTGECSRE